MRRTLLFLLAALFFWGTTQAQFRQYQDVQERVRKALSRKAQGETPKSPATNRKKPLRFQPKAPELPDTAYSVATRKQHGWFAPSGLISAEEASFRGVSYRFSRRDARGHWLRMETVAGNGSYSPGAVNPYILKLFSADSDTLANAEWVERLRRACIFEFIPDPLSGHVVQERAYDEDMNIVYIYSRTPIGPDSLGRERYIGSYKDIYGLPAEMRNNPEYTYGTLVLLTEDRWGNDSVIRYLDARGRRKLNSDGVAQEVYVCDAQGKLLRMQSRDAEGRLAIDNWGNCGVEYTYVEGPLPLVKSATYMDNEWKPMRMPGLRSSGSELMTIRAEYKYDACGREVERRYVTPEALPDTGADGTHRWLTTYDRHGNVASYKFYGLDGKLNTCAYGYAVAEFAYDSAGRETEVKLFDENGSPCSQPGTFYSRETQYDAGGNISHQLELTQESGRPDTSYLYHRTRDVEYTRFADHTVRIDSFDTGGRTLSITWYDTHGKPIVKSTFGGHRQVATYAETGPGRTRQQIVMLDVDGKPYGEMPCEEWWIDSVAHVQQVRKYSPDGRLLDIFCQKLDARNEIPLQQTDANAFGVVCRAGGSSGVRFYKADVSYTQKHTIASLIGKDEFGEPDYIDAFTGLLYYYQNATAVGTSKFYDENSREIPDMEAFRDSCPKVLTVEVTDSLAYRLGLRDNDVILTFGSYAADLHHAPTLHEFLAKWVLHSLLDAERSRDMVVYRVEPSTLQCRLVRLALPAGTQADLGFIAHPRYLTRKQLARLRRTVEANEASAEPLVAWEELGRGYDLGGTHSVVFDFPDLFRDRRFTPYGEEIGARPSLLLAFEVPGEGLRWETGEDFASFDKFLAARSADSGRYPTIDFYFTPDLRNVQLLRTNEQTMDVNFYTCQVNDSVYARILSLTAVAHKKMKAAAKERPVYGEKQLRGDWKIEVVNEQLHLSLEFTLGRRGKLGCSIRMTGVTEADETTEPLMDIIVSLEGNWHVERNRLVLEADTNTVDIRYTLLNIGDLDEGLKEQVTEYLRTSMPESELKSVARMFVSSFCMPGGLPIVSCSEEALVLYDGTDARFTRVRKQ